MLFIVQYLTSHYLGLRQTIFVLHVRQHGVLCKVENLENFIFVLCLKATVGLSS